MQITDVRVRKLFDDEGPMKAIVSVTFDGQLALHDIKVIYAREKLFVVMPSRKNPDNTYRDIVHPINAEFRQHVESTSLPHTRLPLQRLNWKPQAKSPLPKKNEFANQKLSPKGLFFVCPLR